MKENTHLPKDKYLSDAALGMGLQREMQAAAATITGDDDARVTFFNDPKDGEDSFGYEVESEGKHVQLDSGYELLTDAVAAFIEWSDRNLDDEDEDEDED